MSAAKSAPAPMVVLPAGAPSLFEEKIEND
jgi:hypothetical protein